MALTFNQAVRERKRVVRVVKSQLRGLDTQLEMTQRTINRLLARKRKLPELNDLEGIVEMVQAMGTAFASTERALSDAHVVFAGVGQ